MGIIRTQDLKQVIKPILGEYQTLGLVFRWLSEAISLAAHAISSGCHDVTVDRGEECTLNQHSTVQQNLQNLDRGHDWIDKADRWVLSRGVVWFAVLWLIGSVWVSVLKFMVGLKQCHCSGGSVIRIYQTRLAGTLFHFTSTLQVKFPRKPSRSEFWMSDMSAFLMHAKFINNLL